MEMGTGYSLSVSGEEAMGSLLTCRCNLSAALRSYPRILCISGANDGKCGPRRPSAQGRICLPGCPGRQPPRSTGIDWEATGVFDSCGGGEQGTHLEAQSLRPSASGITQPWLSYMTPGIGWGVRVWPCIHGFWA